MNPYPAKTPQSPLNASPQPSYSRRRRLHWASDPQISGDQRVGVALKALKAASDEDRARQRIELRNGPLDDREPSLHRRRAAPQGPAHPGKRYLDCCGRCAARLDRYHAMTTSRTSRVCQSRDGDMATCRRTPAASHYPLRVTTKPQRLHWTFSTVSSTPKPKITSITLKS